MNETTQNPGQEFPIMAAETPYLGHVNEVPVVVAPPGWTTTQLDDCMEKPRRVKETIQITCLKSFVAYLLKHKEQSTIIKFDAVGNGDLTARAIIDYHQAPGDGAAKNGPMWGQHLAIYQTRSTPSWVAWFNGNDRKFKQSTFADFIYQNMADVMDPAGAELLEIIQTLRLLSKGEFKESKDLHTGSAELLYSMKFLISGTATTEKVLTLPKQMTIKVTPFYGGPEITLTADIIIEAPKADGDPVLLGYRFYRLGDALEAMSGDIEKQIAKDTKVPVYRCK